ncbi:RNA ligase family protein [Kitasatospora sp. NPDC004240]
MPHSSDRPAGGPADARDWAPYPKIPARARLSAATGVRTWVAAEKVHGANLAVLCDATGAHPAKRRELLDGEALDGFFGLARIWPALSVAADRCAAALRTAYGAEPGSPVTLYGELAGGRYPHPDVPASPGSQPVQTGVWYGPGLHWFPFDATVSAPRGTCWVSDGRLRDAAGAAGLHCAPLLGHGGLTRLQALSAEFATRLPGLLGLPELPGNLAEGLVIKPADDWWTSDGPERPVAKVKQPAFAEDGRFAGARPYRPPAEGAAGVPGWLLAQAATLLTPTRAAAAVGKLGPHATPQEVADEVTADVVTELAEDLGGLDTGQHRALAAALAPGALALARHDAADRRTR